MKKIVFLRGVNVNGVSIKMNDLKKSLESLGFTSVETILATGNIVIDICDKLNTDDLKEKIEKKLREDFNYDAFIVIMTEEALKDAIKKQPFNLSKDKQIYLILSSRVDLYKDIEDLFETKKDITKEAFMHQGDYAYWSVEKGFTLKTSFGKKLLGSKEFKPFITTRNINTILKIEKKLML